MSVFIHQINFQQKSNVQFKKIPKAITVLASSLLIYNYVQDCLICNTQWRFNDLFTSAGAFHYAIEMSPFGIYIYNRKNPLLGATYG